MILLVTGGRHFNSIEDAFRVLDKVHRKVGIELLVQGDAKGADTIAKKWAIQNGVELISMPAQWAQHGVGAGIKRNLAMMQLLLARLEQNQKVGVLAFPGGKGTEHMVKAARANGITVMEALQDEFCSFDSETENTPTQSRLEP